MITRKLARVEGRTARKTQSHRRLGADCSGTVGASKSQSSMGLHGLLGIRVVIIWNLASYSPFMNRRFEEKYHLHPQGRKSAEQETSV
jgi:hypothetical protein